MNKINADTLLLCINRKGTYLATIHYSTPFFIMGICSAILGILIYFKLPHLQTLQQESHKQTIFSRYNQLLHISKTVPLFFAYFLFQTGNLKTKHCLYILKQCFSLGLDCCSIFIFNAGFLNNTLLCFI